MKAVSVEIDSFVAGLLSYGRSAEASSVLGGIAPLLIGSL
jgi:hypothetical protein